MPGVVYSLTRFVVNPVSCTGQQKECHGGCSPPGLSFPMGDTIWVMPISAWPCAPGWDGSILGSGSGTWLQSPTRLRSSRNAVPSPRHGEGFRRCRKPRHCRWGVCLDVPEQETSLRGIFCFKVVDYGASCFREEV